MSDPNLNRPGGPPPPREPREPRDRGTSAMALIVGALAVILIIGAVFWFAGDTQDTAVLDEPDIVIEEDAEQQAEVAEEPASEPVTEDQAGTVEEGETTTVD